MKKIAREPKWSGSGLSEIVLESENGNKGTLHQKRARQRREPDRLRKKRCIQGESSIALHLAHFLKLFRPLLCHFHRYLHVVKRISTCIFPDILLREAYSAHAYS